MSKLIDKAIIEILRNNINKGKGDLMQTITKDENAQIHQIQLLMREYSDNVEKFKTAVIADRENNTRRRNGEQIQSHEVIADFLNQKGKKIKNTLK